MVGTVLKLALSETSLNCTRDVASQDTCGVCPSAFEIMGSPDLEPRFGSHAEETCIFLIHSLLGFLKQKVMTVGARFIYHQHLITSGNKGEKPNDAEKQIALNILQREW